jgi:hypothetical protein
LMQTHSMSLSGLQVPSSVLFCLQADWRKAVELFLELQMAGMDAGVTLCVSLMINLRKANRPAEALELFEAVEASSSVRPEVMLWNGGLASAIALQKFSRSRQIHEAMLKNKVPVEHRLSALLLAAM